MEKLFRDLNNNCNYIVLRGWDSFDHFNYNDDIDILCDDRCKVIDILKARPLHRNSKRCNYIVKGDSHDIKIDIRYVGDNYYCQSWQRDMLASKQFYNYFYVMDRKNYYFSLIYHILIHKRKFSNKYEKVLSRIYEGSDCFKMTYEFLLCDLKEWMKKNKYMFTVPEDYAVNTNWDLLKAEGGSFVRLKEIESKMLKKWDKILYK